MARSNVQPAGGDDLATLLRFYRPGERTGDIYYVSSVTGTDSTGYGRSPTAPFASLDYAITQATASNNDTIFLLAGHSETYTTTGTKATFNKAGVSIVGLGEGASRPTFTFSHTGATFVWSAAGVTLKNVLLVTGIDSVTTFCTISGADATLEDIETRDTTDVETIDTFITTTAADRLTVRRHLHNGYTSGDANARVWKLVGCDRGLFEDCRFITKVTTGVINFTGTLSTGMMFRRCLFLVTSTTNYSKDVVDTVGSSTYALQDCFDLGAGANIGGGSGSSVGTADVSTITNALYGASGIATWPVPSTAPGDAVSMAEALASVWAGLWGTAANYNGIDTFPAAALPANAVSLTEVLREAYDQSEKAVVKAAATLVNGTTIFTIANGSIQIMELFAYCLTANDTTASTLQFSSTPTLGTAKTISGASASLASAAAGAIVTLNQTALTTAPDLTTAANGGVALGANVANKMIVNPGTMTIVIGTGSTTGTWEIHMRYKPLARGVTVS